MMMACGGFRKLHIFLTLALMLASAGAVLGFADDANELNELAQFYGFSGIELFEVEDRAFNMQAGDFTSDGLTDVMVIDNRDSSLRLMVQRSKADETKLKAPMRVNDLTSDWRFEARPITVDKTLLGIAAGDFNSDGRLDIACLGEPDQLAIRYQPEAGEPEWNDKWTTRLPGLEPVSWMIAAGDLNSDQRHDVVILGKDSTYIIYQNAQGQMDPPVSLINTSASLSLVQLADLNGDGRTDLCYMANEGSTRGLCARLQTQDGRLGPEMCFDLQQPRSVTLANADQQPGHEIVTIESRSGHVLISRLQAADDAGPDMLPTRLLQFGIGPATAARERAVATGDVDGDGLIDVLINDPEQAQLLLYRQNGIDGLGTAEIFPSLLGITDLTLADVDGDGKPEAILLSPKEGLVAVSRFANGRMAFPETLAQKPEGQELAAVSVLNTANGTQIVVALTKGTGTSTKLGFQQLVRAADGSFAPAELQEPVELAGVVGARGVRLVRMDVNGNGLDDVLVVPSGTSKSGVQVLTQQTDGNLKVAEQKSSLDLGVSSAGRTFVSGSRLLVARDSFARAMSFGDSGWSVADQFNAGEASAALEGVAAVNLDGMEGDEIVLVDTGVRKVRVLRAQDGVYRPWKEVDLGSLQFTSVAVADLNGDGRPDLLLAGAKHFSVLYAGRADLELKELATWEPDRDDAYPADAMAGDINNDGRMDLTLIDTSINGLEILNLDPDKGLRAATHFSVFEEKRLVSDADDRGTEPREGVVADFTGDGRADLLLLCHDRLILYPQDPGDSPPATPSAGAK